MRKRKTSAERRIARLEREHKAKLLAFKQAKDESYRKAIALMNRNPLPMGRDIKLGREDCSISAEQKKRNAETTKAIWEAAVDMEETMPSEFIRDGKKVRINWVDFHGKNSTKSRNGDRVYFPREVLSKHRDAEHMEVAASHNTTTSIKEDRDGIERLSRSGNVIGGKFKGGDNLKSQPRLVGYKKSKTKTKDTKRGFDEIYKPEPKRKEYFVSAPY